MVRKFLIPWHSNGEEMELKFYHNPRCSKSRKAKKLLEEKEIKILEDKLNQLNDGKEVVANDKDEAKFLTTLGLLSIKPKIIVCNVDEESLAKGNPFTENVKKNYSEEKIVTICADIS